MRQDLFKCFDIDPLTDDFLGLIVFFQRCTESIGFALSTIQPGLRVAFRLIDDLGGFTLGSWDNIVAVSLRLVDQFFSVFFGVGHIFERRCHSFGRIDILQLDGCDLHSGRVLIEYKLEQILSVLLNHRLPCCQRFIDLALPDHFSHRRLGSFHDGLVNVSHIEQILARVLNFVLYNKFNGQNVHVAGQHERFLRDHLLAPLAVFSESHLNTVKLGHFRLQHAFYERNFEMRARRRGANGNAETFDDAFFIGRDDEGALPDQKDGGGHEDDVF